MSPTAAERYADYYYFYFYTDMNNYKTDCFGSHISHQPEGSDDGAVNSSSSLRNMPMTYV